MKKLTMLVTIIFAIAMSLLAETWTDPDTNYIWTYRVNGDTAEIYGEEVWYWDDEEGADRYYIANAIEPTPIGAVVIPSTLGGKPVTSIGLYSFWDCGGLTDVTIPNTVTNIAWGAFEFCEGLTEVTIPNNVASISDWAFHDCSCLVRAYLPKALEGVMDEWVFAGSPVTVYYYEGTEPVFATLTLDAGGGIEDEAMVQVVSNDCVRTLPTPTRNGYTFLGWFTATSGGDEVTAETVVTGDMTVYAHWQEIVYTYNYIDNGDGTVTLSKWDEHDNWMGDGISPLPVGDFALPSEIDGKTVVAIGSDFFNGYGMTAITIPASVTNISCYALYQAYDLTNITVVADNHAYKSIDGILYTKDGKTLVTCPHAKGGDVAVASGTECIGGFAFYSNYNLASVTLPAGLKSIEDYAFEYCQNEDLASVAIPASVESIGGYAFGYCSNLETVTFAGNEAEIDIAATAFVGTPYDATKPFSLIINEYGTLIGIHGRAPANLVLSDNLNGQTLTGIGDSALSGSTFDMSSVTNVVVPEGVGYLGYYAFSYDTALESITLPTSLQYIYYGAFNGCSSLRTITIPSGVTYAEDPFWGCENLTVRAPKTLQDTFSVPDGCTIDYYSVPQYTVTFDANGGTVDGDTTTEWTIYEGRRLESADEYYDNYDLPAPMLNGYAFLGWFTAASGGDEVTAETVVTGNMTVYARWRAIYTVVFDGNGGEMEQWDEDSGYYTVSQISLTVVEGGTLDYLPSVWRWEEGYYFDGWFDVNGIEFTSDTIVTNDMTVTAHWIVDDGTFRMLTTGGVVTGYFGECPAELTASDWPAGVTSIGNAAFRNATTLAEVEIPATVTNIEDYAFADCRSLARLSLNEGLVEIGDCAFLWCSSLTNVVFPASVEVIGDNAFRWSGLMAVDFVGGKGNVAHLAAGAFDRTPWGEENIPFSLIVSESGELQGWHGRCPADLTIPADVTSVDNYAFQNCASLESLTITADNADISLGYGAFSYCPNLKYAYLPKAMEGAFDEYDVFWDSTVVVYYYEGDEPIFATVTLNANGGSVEAASIPVVPNNAVGTLPTPTRDGYEFLGWFTAAEGGGEVTAETVVTGDMTVYAHWDEIVYTYNYIDNGDGTVTLSAYDEYGNWVGAISPAPIGDFVVPDVIDGKQVVAIGDYVLDGGELTSVVIPSSVTNMSDYAMAVWGLTNITVAADNPAYKSVGGILYTKDGMTLLACPIAKGGDVVVEPGTECIGRSAFHHNYWNDYLTSVVLPDSLKVIEFEAVAYCRNASFTSVTIPASVEMIGAYAFAYCPNLETVTFLGDESQIEIADTAFVGTPYDAAGQFALIINEYGTLIGIHGRAPANLVLSDNLNGQTLTGIGDSALSGSTFDMSSVTNVVVPEGVGYLGYYAFSYDTALESITLPTSLQYIYYGAFNGCSSLRTITIPSGVTYVDNPFWGCENLTVYAPDTLEGTFSVPESCTIEYYDVSEYTVTFDANGGRIWNGDEYVESVEMTVLEGRTLNSMPEPNRDGCDFAGWFDVNGKRVGYDFVVTGDVTLSARWLEESPWYWYDDGTGAVISRAKGYSVVSNGVLTIPATIMSLNDDGEEVSLPVVAIGDHAFEGWREVNVLNLPASIEWIEYGAFGNCSRLEIVTFAGDWNDVDVGDGLQTAFYGTPWLNNAQPFTFMTYDDGDEVYLTGWYGSPVPMETLSIPDDVTVVQARSLPGFDTKWDGEKYWEFLGWYTSADGGERVGGDDDVVVIGGTTLYAHWQTVELEWYFYVEDGVAIVEGCSVSLVGDVEIPSSVTVEEDDGNGGTIETAYTVTAIAVDSFYGMDGIESVTIPASVTNIYNWAFKECSSLTNVVFTGGMASVHMTVAAAFYGTPWFMAYRSLLSVPGNDDRENAVVISGVSGSVVGSTLNSSRETDDLIPDEYDSEYPSTVWYRWIAPTNGTFVFFVTDANTASDWSSAVGVTTGYDAEACTWSDSVTSWRTVAVRASKGVEYWIAVGSYCAEDYAQEHDFELSWTSSPDNDEYENAQELAGTETGNVNGTLFGATIADNDCIWRYGDAERTVWYKWIAPFSGLVSFAATAGNGDSDLLYLVATRGYDEDEDEWDDCGYNDSNTVVFDVVEGEAYYVSLATWNYVVNGFTLSWQRLLPPDNDDFADAALISGISGSVSGTNVGASVEEGEPLVAYADSAATVWWTWTAPTNAFYTFYTDGSDFDTVLGVYKGTVVDELEVVAENDDNNGRTSAVSFVVKEGTTYYIAVGGYDTMVGDIVLNWQAAGPDVVVEAGENVVTDNGDGTYTITAPLGGELTADDVDDVEVKVYMDGEWVYTTDGYDITFADGAITVSLKTPAMDPDVDASIKDPDDKSGFLVDPDLVTVRAEPDLGVGDELGALPVNAVPGLWYRASWTANLGDGFTDGEWVQATDSELYLGVVKQTGASGFYKVSVSE